MKKCSLRHTRVGLLLNPFNFSMCKIRRITIVMAKLVNCIIIAMYLLYVALLNSKSNTNNSAMTSYRERCLIFSSEQCFGEGLCVPEMKINILSLSSVTLSATWLWTVTIYWGDKSICGFLSFSSNFSSSKGRNTVITVSLPTSPDVAPSCQEKIIHTNYNWSHSSDNKISSTLRQLLQ